MNPYTAIARRKKALSVLLTLLIIFSLCSCSLLPQKLVSYADGEYCSEYYRSLLSDKSELKLYDKMRDTILANDDKVSIRGYSVDTINKISLYVVLDNVYSSMTDNRYSYREVGEASNPLMKYLQSENVPFTLTDKNYPDKMKEAQNRAAEIVSGIEISRDDYYTALEIHDYLITNVRYCQEPTENSSNIYGALIEQNAQCEGFANAFMLLCRMCGLECFKAFYLGSDVGAESGHMFNCVRVNGNYYYVDVTNDAFVEGASVPQGAVAYDYFLVPLSGLSEPDLVNEQIADLLPEVTSDADNFFVRNSLIFSSYSREAVGSAIGKFLNAQKGSGQIGASVKFTNEAAYKKATATSVERQRLAAVIDKYDGYTVDSYSYVKNNTQLILRFYPAE